MFESYQLQRHFKEVETLRGTKYDERCRVLGKAAMTSLCPDLIHARWRLDLLWNNKTLGLRVHTDAGIAFKPINDFDNASTQITELSRWFAATCPSESLMSLRFREGTMQKKGLWIDASRADLDHLKTHHKDWIKEALNLNIAIEIGQRHEEWIENDDGDIKSTRAKLRTWLPSYAQDLTPIPLVSTIAAFSQPGPLANQALLSAGHLLLDQHLQWKPEYSWGEWGAGNGNLSASFARRLGDDLAWISEPDPKSFLALKDNHSAYFAKAEISRTAAIMAPENFELWILDPPRSGFADLIGRLEPKHAPSTILIYHCAMDGLNRDSEMLKQKGYHLRDWIFCDVFPGSSHAEAVSLWTQTPC